MAAVRSNFMSNQSSTMYSQETINETLTKQTQKLYNGAVGIDFHNLAKPGNLANSAVLRMLEEEESGRSGRKIVQGSGRAGDPYSPWIARYHEHSLHKKKELTLEEVKKLSSKTSVHQESDWRFAEPLETRAETRTFRQSPGRLKRVAWPPPPENPNRSQQNTPEPQILQGFEGVPQVAPKLPGQQTVQQPPQQAQQFGGVVKPVAGHRPLETHQVQEPVVGRQVGNEPVVEAVPAVQAVRAEPPKSKVTLLPSAPIRQAPPPVITSQPATMSVQGGSRMRGDQKWPPENVKQQSEAENAARVALAKGPACRPRRVKKDYSTFFAQHALNSTYPGYRAPPGTQHYIEEGTSNL